MFLTTIKSGLFFIAFSLVLLSCQKSTLPARHTIDLSGAWQFSLDQADVGIQEKWYVTDLPDVIELPGTTDTRGKGFLNQDSSTMHLNRVYRYEGAAWYRKEITIPAEFRDQVVRLIIERTKSSQVWIDDHFVGESHLLQSPQKYDVSTYLSPGEHSITLRIDNSLKLTPYGNVHIYTDETQTNWNGVIGKFVLEAAPKTHIADLQIFPDIDRRNIHIQLTLINGLGLAAVDLELQVRRTENGKNKTLKSIHQTVPCDSILHLDYALGDDMKLWDDYQQPLYHLTAVISQGTLHDSKTVPFGMRRFTAAGKQFAINGRTTFLRGKHDGCVFPITGHPPMDADGWIRVFKIARSYGINHYRFHSYCPPEAAFTAADQLGLFLQPELPFWGYLESDTVAARLKAEAVAMLKSYANHPSLVMFGAGNEIGGGYERVEKIITDLKDIDPRPLYTFGSNNSIGYVGPSAGSDFHIAARTPFAHDTTLTHTRLTHAFVDSKDGGILNTQMPSTMVNFDYAVAQIKTPLISHEMGQYQIYPDYQEIEKYTGVLRAWNLEIFRNRLKKTDMLDQNAAFTRASGAWAALCYKAEMEAALRTAEMAGFQLLDLQDYPGQGTAL
ncbi:MAG: beta-galactosidase, partial [Calditrichaeota bacterium]